MRGGKRQVCFMQGLPRTDGPTYWLLIFLWPGVYKSLWVTPRGLKSPWLQAIQVVTLIEPRNSIQSQHFTAAEVLNVSLTHFLSSLWGVSSPVCERRRWSKAKQNKRDINCLYVPPVTSHRRRKCDDEDCDVFIFNSTMNLIRQG